MAVIIDAGHGGADNGASYNGRLEKDDTLEIALAVGELLQENGVDVLYTRTEDVYDSPLKKAQIANESGADYFISIHRNSSTYPGQYTGVQTLLYDENGIKKEMADNINSELEDVGFRNIGTDIRRDLAVLRRTSMPALLVEVGFINSDTDNKILDNNFDAVAQAIADGVLNTLNSRSTSTSSAAATPVISTNSTISNRTNSSEAQDPLVPNNRGYASDPSSSSTTPFTDFTPQSSDDMSYPYESDNTNSSFENDYSDLNDDMPQESAFAQRYKVQVGLYRQYQNAVNMTERLKAIKIPAVITQKNDLYAVLAGRPSTLREAVRLERLLRLMCFDTLIVAV